MAKRTLKHIQGSAGFTTKAVLQMAAAAIPVIGAPISTAISFWEGQVMSQRMEKLVEETKRLAMGVQEKLDAGYVATEQFQDVVLAAIDAGRRASSQDKRRLVAAILVGAALKDRPADLEADALLDAVGTLSVREVHLLRQMRIRERGGIVEVATLPRETQPDLVFHLKRIESAGLISEEVQVGIPYGSRYRFTTTFGRLLRLIEAAGSPLVSGPNAR